MRPSLHVNQPDTSLRAGSPLAGLGGYEAASRSRGVSRG